MMSLENTQGHKKELCKSLKPGLSSLVLQGEELQATFVDFHLKSLSMFYNANARME